MLGRRRMLGLVAAALAVPHVARGWSGSVDARTLGLRPGDGDAAPALQQAVDAMAAGGGTLRLAPGEYRLGRTVRLPSGILLDGPGAVLFEAPGGPGGEAWVRGAVEGRISRFALLANRHHAADALTDRDIALRRLTLEYRGPQRGDAHAIAMRQVEGVSVSECRFLGGGNGTAFLSCRETVVERCEARQTLNCAYDHWEGSSDGVVRDCFAHCATGYGILFTGQGTERDNHRDARRLLAQGNVIENPSTAGIWICSLSERSSVHEVALRGNTVRGGAGPCHGMGATGDVRAIVIDANTVEKVEGGNALFSRPDTWHRPRDIAITGNTVRDSTPSARSVALIQALGDRVTVRGNRAFGGRYRSLVWVDGEEVTLADNAGDGLTSRFKYNAAAAKGARIDDP
jgi:hypothetical protein